MRSSLSSTTTTTWCRSALLLALSSSVARPFSSVAAWTSSSSSSCSWNIHRRIHYDANADKSSGGRHSARRWMSQNHNNQNDQITNEASSSSKKKQQEMTRCPPREAILKKAPKKDHKIINHTLDWIQNVVIGLNLCPFAEKPWFRPGQLDVRVLRGTDQVEILAQVLGECQHKQHAVGTSLLVCPDLFPKNFLSFLEVYNMAQDGVLVDHDLQADIQIAPFHPQFVFEGSDQDGIDNFTNMSPYPTFHILREAEVAEAVDALQGDASKVWKRNVELLEQMEETLEREEIQQIMSGKLSLLLRGQRDAGSDSDLRARVERILQEMKKQKSTNKE